MLKLQEEGKLSLDDKVAQVFPRARQRRPGDAPPDPQPHRRLPRLLAPGLRDPRDEPRPRPPQAVLDEWAKKPLDFAPGTDWQYSNTGFVVAGAIVEKVSGQPLVDFLQANVFDPLKMAGVIDADQARADASAYTRWGARPGARGAEGRRGLAVRGGRAGHGAQRTGQVGHQPDGPQPAEAGLLRGLLHADQADSGRDSHYSVGLACARGPGPPVLSHGGGGSGFLSANRMWPDQKVAVVAFTNNDWASPGRRGRAGGLRGRAADAGRGARPQGVRAIPRRA